MHRSLQWFIKGLQPNQGLIKIACLTGHHVQRSFKTITSSSLLEQQYRVKPSFTSFNDEETLSYKVLEHMRTQPVYSAISSVSKKQVSLSSAFGERYATKQLLSVIAHSTPVLVGDILELFSRYSASDNFLTQDLIADRILMKTVFSKVTHSLHLMKPVDIQQLAISLRQLKFQKTGYLNRLARNISAYCEQLASESDLTLSLKLFDILLILYGNNIYKTEHFDTFMALFEANIKNAQVHELVQILHYTGLGKTRKFSKEYAYKAIRQLEPYFHSLSFTDAGIAAAGIFKSGVTVDESSVLVQATVRHLKSKLKKAPLLNDLESYGTVAMIKLLRLTKYQDSELLSLLSAFVLKTDARTLSPQVVPHILAFYANNRIYMENVFAHLEKSVLYHLSTPPCQIRMRDFTRLLWCFSQTGHEFSAQLLTAINKYLKEFCHCREVTVNPHLLSDSLLSLAVCGYYPPELIKEAFEARIVKGLKGHQRSKQLSRLLMLYECIQVEAPELIVEPPMVSQNDLPKRTLSDEISYRPMLATLWEGAKLLNEILGAQVLKLKFVIPHINYASLILDFSHLNNTGSLTSVEQIVQNEHIVQQLYSVKEKSHGHSVALELLDYQSLIQETTEPIGIIRLKLRLMRRIGWKVTEVYFTEIEESCSDTRAVAALIIDKVTKCK